MSRFHPHSNSYFEKVNEFVDRHPQLQKMISSHKTINMDFFSKLADMESVDLTIRIFKKNDKLTLNLMPGSGNSTTMPILVTGTPTELDEEFFDKIMPQMKIVSGLITNIEEVTKGMEKELEQKKESKPAKVDKPAAEKKVEKPIESKVQSKQIEPDLFGAVAVPAVATPVDEKEEEEEEVDSNE